MGKYSWKSVLCTLLLLLLILAVILYVQELKTSLSTKGATLVMETDVKETFA